MAAAAAWLKRGSTFLIVLVAFGFPSARGVDAQQGSTTAGVSVPFTSSSGFSSISGVLRITQFVERGGSAFAVGTVSIATSQGNAPGALVTQVAVPVISASSDSSGAVVRFGSGSASAGATAAGAGIGTGVATPGAAAGLNVSGTVGSFGAAAAPTAATPGQQADCGPLRVEIGPVDLAGVAQGLRLDRLVVDIAAPRGTITNVNALMCSADAALAGAASANASTVTAPAGDVFGSTQPGGTAGAVGTAGSAGRAPALQALVSALNQVLGAL
jgi:hypothetical protein